MSETRCVRFVTMEVKDLVCNEIIEIKHVTETRSFSTQKEKRDGKSEAEVDS